MSDFQALELNLEYENVISTTLRSSVISNSIARPGIQGAPDIPVDFECFGQRVQGSHGLGYLCSLSWAQLRPKRP